MNLEELLRVGTPCPRAGFWLWVVFLWDSNQVVDHLIEESYLSLSPPCLQCVPPKLPKDLCNTGIIISSIWLPYYKACCRSLYVLKLVDLVLVVGVPYDAAVLDKWPD